MKTIVLLCLSLSSFLPPKTITNPEREDLLNKVFLLLETHIANPDWLKSDTFKTFKEDLYSEKVMRMSDDDFMNYINQKRKTLNFSHFNLHSKVFLEDLNSKESELPVLYWKALSKKTAYLKVRTFVSDASAMTKAIREIGTDTYENLIIDLRDNGGGSLDAPVVLGRFLTQDYIDAGVYLNRSWFEKNNRPATKEDINNFPYLKDFTFQGISKMYANSDAFRMVLPPHNEAVYKGKVFILINSNTASACEPLIDILKAKGLATLVGTVSAGNMLTGQYFKINDNYKVFIPIADYQTADGRRIDKIGVKPDYQVTKGDCLEYVLNQLIK